MMRLYVFKDEVGMAIIAARNPQQAKQMATWDWGKNEPIHVGDASPSVQDEVEVIEEIVLDRKSKKRWQGRSLLDRMWQELDDTYDALMDLASDKKSDPQEVIAKQNYALGIAFCISHVQAPYSPDIDEVRRQARERWEERDDDE